MTQNSTYWSLKISTTEISQSFKCLRTKSVSLTHSLTQSTPVYLCGPERFEVSQREEMSVGETDDVAMDTYQIHLPSVKKHRTDRRWTDNEKTLKDMVSSQRIDRSHPPSGPKATCTAAV